MLLTNVKITFFQTHEQPTNKQTNKRNTNSDLKQVATAVSVVVDDVAAAAAVAVTAIVVAFDVVVVVVVIGA